MTDDDTNEDNMPYPSDTESYEDLLDRDDEIAAYMRARKSAVSRNTWEQYGTALRHLAEFVDDRAINLGELDDDDAADLISWLKAKESTTDGTVKDYTRLMAQMYHYGIRRKKSDDFAEITYNAIAVAREDEQWNDDRPTERRDIPLKVMRQAVLSIRHPLLLCIVVMLLKTGMRVSEMVNLDMRDVNLDHHWFQKHFDECRQNLAEKPDTLYVASAAEMRVGEVVNGEERKDPNKRKRGTYIPIDNELKAVMLLWLAIRPPSRSPAEPFFCLTTPGSNSIPGDRLQSDYVWSLITDWTEEQGWWESGATLKTNVSTHYFRHYFRTVFGSRVDDYQLVKYLRGDKGESMDDYYHYWGDYVREPYLQAIYKLF